jgi:hypothetical protein
VEKMSFFHEFYPRCYDVCDTIELEDFLEEFKFCHAQKYLKENISAENLSILQKAKLQVCLESLPRKFLSLK